MKDLDYGELERRVYHYVFGHPVYATQDPISMDEAVRHLRDSCCAVPEKDVDLIHLRSLRALWEEVR